MQFCYFLIILQQIEGIEIWSLYYIQYALRWCQLGTHSLLLYLGGHRQGMGSISSNPIRLKNVKFQIQTPSLGSNVRSSFPIAAGQYEPCPSISYHELLSLLSISTYPPCSMTPAPLDSLSEWCDATSIQLLSHTALREGPFSLKSTEDASEIENTLNCSNA